MTACVPFVVGASRSGTTLLRLMLDAHPDLAIPPETGFIPAAVEAVRDSPNPAKAFCDAVITSPRWRDFHLSAEAFTTRITTLEPFDLSEATRTFYRLYAARFRKPRWGDKTPYYLHHLALIQRVLPEARFIHLIRDGRDVACSILPLGWSWGPHSIPEAALWWMERIRIVRAQTSEISGYLEVRFEDLVSAPEQTLGQIAEFTSLPFSSSMLAYYDHSAERLAEMSGSITNQSGDVILDGEARLAMHHLTSLPPQSQRIERWRHDMTAGDCVEFEKIAGSLLEELGYPLSS